MESTVTQLMQTSRNSCCSFNESTPTLGNASITASNSSSGPTFTGLAIRDIGLWSVFVIIGAFGMIGNATVAIVLLRFTEMRRRLTNIYIINQSLVDCMAATFLFITTVYQDDTIQPGFLGEIKCRLWLVKIPFWSFMMSSAFNLVAITVERYFKVVHPIAHRVSFTRPKAIVTVIFVWLLGWFYMLASNLTTAAVVNGACVFGLYPNNAAKQTVNVIHFVLQYLGPILVFMFCYSRMALVLRQGQFKTAPAAETMGSNGKPKKASSERAVRNIIKTMIVVCVVFFICFSPNQWLFFLFNFGLFDYRVFSNPIYNISVIAIYLNCCVNPVIYVSSYEQFQKALRRFLCPKSMSKAGIASGGETTAAGLALSAVR